MRTPACSRLWVRRVIETFAFEEASASRVVPFRNAVVALSVKAITSFCVSAMIDCVWASDFCTSPSVVSTSPSVPRADEREPREDVSPSCVSARFSRADERVWVAWSKALRVLSLAFSSRSSVESPTSLRAFVAASATCSLKAVVTCLSSSEAPTSVIFGAIAPAFSLT